MCKSDKIKNKLNYGQRSTTKGIETIDMATTVSATKIAAGNRTTIERVIRL